MRSRPSYYHAIAKAAASSRPKQGLYTNAFCGYGLKRNMSSMECLDLANKPGGIPQSGPLTHLQFGGHHHGNRAQDHPLKVPRWCHPPMDVALLCEVVAANFYEEEWLGLRDEPNWCQSISLFQRLCYTHYFDSMTKSLSMSSTTALRSMWASTYT